MALDVADLVCSIARNASTSPLLTLPLEIRNKIWTEVLGDRLIHLDYFYDDDFDFEDNESLHRGWKYSEALGKYYGSAWRHVVCEDDGPENRPIEKRIIDEGEEYEQTVSFRPHQFCDTDYEEPNPAYPVKFYDHETMRLTVLRSCRQIYVEANQILWTTNTFSFGYEAAFQRFMMTRNIHQKRLIRNLRMHMDFELGSRQGWNSSLNMSVVRSLSGLQTLRLYIVHNLPTDFYHSYFSRNNSLFIRSFYEGLYRLSTLPLNSAEIALRNAHYRNSEEHWTQSQRDDVAGHLQRMLLDPKGAEIYEETQRKEKEEVRIRREREMKTKEAMRRSLGRN